MTAFSDELYAARGYALGAVDYILSPVVPEVLRTKVGVFVQLFLMAQQVRRQADERVALAEEQAARAAAEEATRRADFLAEASKVLSRSLDPGDTIANLARLTVPFLADLGAVTLVGEHGRPWHTELAWCCPPDGGVQTAALTESEAPRDELRCEVQVRHRGKPLPCNVQGERVVLDEAALGVAPGQSAVFYRGDELLGGAKIK